MKISNTNSNHRQAPGARAIIVLFASRPAVLARSVAGRLAWSSFAASPPVPPQAGPWLFFTDEEAATVEAIVDRLILADELDIGGKEAGCAVFIDRQLARIVPSTERHAMEEPFTGRLPQFNAQSVNSPAQRYRSGLARLNEYCRSTFCGKTFPELGSRQQDKVLQGLEQGAIHLGALDPKAFFALVLQDTMEGFLADPVYGETSSQRWKKASFARTRYAPANITGRSDCAGKA
ncbi:hypothetical protein GCM10011491_22500 [Brucella endophytica]|uniref:Gluconate 2-dehydrogenase subunit 3 family protein n=1 Tax=Brucella endophytica TaxID=1963359 RepID=A0A916WES6_9HYPH|nr:gluconate 2-dehydrogenase subunit 3 family protein [Brucella endophytica]GGA93805.1 hypothetical protein GCM10011491_22500 [Brucella endophytica]